MKDRINLFSAYSFTAQSNRLERLECVNRINEQYLMVRAYVSGSGSIVFVYDITIKGGLTKQNLVFPVKRFASIPLFALEDSGSLGITE